MRNLTNAARRETAALMIIILLDLMFVAAKGPSKAQASAERQSTHEMVHLSGGRMIMGIDTSEIPKFQQVFSIGMRELFEVAVPKHSVNVHPFFIDRYLVTNSEFKSFVESHPEWRPGKIAARLDNGHYLKHWAGGTFTMGRANHPVVNINWYAAAAYCQAQGKRLPLEAEWEYAARGGLEKPVFPWGDQDASPKLANYSAGGLHTTSPVGSYPPNGYDIYDMAGNVWEFLSDEWNKYPSGRGTTASESPRADLQNSFMDVRTRRVIRGGSFEGDPLNLWVEYRDSHPPDGSQSFVGFRCAK